MGLAVTSWEQQLGEESSNWEHRGQLVPTGTACLVGQQPHPAPGSGLGWQGPVRGCAASAPLLPTASQRVLLLATKGKKD